MILPKRRPRLWWVLREAYARALRPPAPFDCAWCAGKGSTPERQHDMCTGVAVRPNLERGVPAAVVSCACADRGHRVEQR